MKVNHFGKKRILAFEYKNKMKNEIRATHTQIFNLFYVKKINITYLGW